MEDVKITLVDGGNDTAAAATATTKPVVPSTTTGGYVKTESAAVKKRSFQLRALTRKTLAYQKRQTFVNCCCVVYGNARGASLRLS